MKFGLNLMLAACSLVAASSAAADTVDYIYKTVGADPHVTTFSLDTTQLKPLGISVRTGPDAIQGTVDGASTDFGTVYLWGLHGELLLGGYSTTQAAATPPQSLSGAQLFGGSAFSPTLRTGSFELYAYEGGLTPETNPAGVLSVFTPSVYNIDITGKFLGKAFDINFDTTSSPLAYGQTGGDDPYGPDFIGQNAILDLDGKTRGFSGIRFYQGGELFFGPVAIGDNGVSFPGNFSSSRPYYTGPLYNAAFVPGHYSVTNDTFGDQETDLMTITRVSGVPETSVWTMLVGGFGLVGAVARRRARRYSLATA